MLLVAAAVLAVPADSTGSVYPRDAFPASRQMRNLADQLHSLEVRGLHGKVRIACAFDVALLLAMCRCIGKELGAGHGHRFKPQDAAVVGLVMVLLRVIDGPAAMIAFFVARRTWLMPLRAALRHAQSVSAISGCT